MTEYEYDVALSFAGEISADEELSDPLLASTGISRHADMRSHRHRRKTRRIHRASVAGRNAGR